MGDCDIRLGRGKDRVQHDTLEAYGRPIIGAFFDDSVMGTATQVAWIAGDRILAGKIVDLCVRCRFLNKKFYSDGGRLLF